MSYNFIGIINFNKKKPIELIRALIELKYDVVTVEHYQDYVHVVKNANDVERWILYGNDYYGYISSINEVNMNLFALDKHFLLYSYPMQSFLKQKGVSISGTSTVHKGELKLPMTKSYLFENMRRNKHVDIYRHHKHYVKGEYDHLDVLNKHGDMIMTAKYKDSSCKNKVVLVQWLPEKTIDGKVFLHNWMCKN